MRVSEKLARLRVHYYARRALGVVALHRVAYGSFGVSLYLEIYSERRIESVYRRKIPIRRPRQFFTYKVGFIVKFAVDARKIVVVVLLETALSVTVNVSESEKLRQKIAVRIISLAFSREKYSVEIVALYFQHIASFYIRSYFYFRRPFFRDFCVYAIVTQRKNVASHARYFFVGFNGIRADIHRIHGFGIGENHAVSIRNDSAFCAQRKLSRPLIERLHLQFAVHKYFNEHEPPKQSAKKKSYQQKYRQ